MPRKNAPAWRATQGDTDTPALRHTIFIQITSYINYNLIALLLSLVESLD